MKDGMFGPSWQVFHRQVFHRQVAQAASARWLWILCLACLLGSGCREPEVETPRRASEIVDVRPMIEEIETSGDPQAVAKKPVLVGFMPSSFPGDLPLFLPASLTDFGTEQGGLRSVSLSTPAGAPKVRRDLMSLLAQAGWQAEASEGDRTLLRKEGRTVRLRIESASTGTVYHFQY